MKKTRKTEFDLEERTAKFGEEIVKFVKLISKNSITIPLISQLVRAGTSVGANYCEANNAQSKREFIYKISTCKKEIKETQYWLRIMIEAMPNIKSSAQLLNQEAQELTLIFSAILSSCRKNKGLNN
jgi:four helix bundle protein